MDEEEADGPGDRALNFDPDHRFAIDELRSAVRAHIARPTTTPKQIYGLAVLLHALNRLPVPTVGCDVSASVGIQYSSGDSVFQTIKVCEDSFTASTYGVENTPGVGPDSYTTFDMEIGINYRSGSAFFPEWVEEFRERLSGGGNELDVTVEDSTFADDWDGDTQDEEFWAEMGWRETV